MPGTNNPSSKRRMSWSLRMALSYSIFLFLCLSLALVLYVNATYHARDNYWNEHAEQLARNAETLTHYMSILDNYTRQLLTDSTFVRLSNMGGMEEQRFLFTAYQVMQNFSARLFSTNSVPVLIGNVYLPKSGYVISASQFTEVRNYYEDYRVLTPGLYEQWLEAIAASGADGTFIDAEPYTGVAGTCFFARDIDAILNRSVPAIIIFELDMDQLRALFLRDDLGENPVVVIHNGAGERQLVLAGEVDAAFVERMEAAALDASGLGDLDEKRVLRVTDESGWVYTAAIDRSLCDEALGNHDLLFLILMAVALAGGAALVVLLVRHNMRPIRQLGTQLEKAEDDRNRLQKEMDDQRPLLYASYLRKLLSGHVSSSEEFAYITRFLGLEGAESYYVLYCVAYLQESVQGDPEEELRLVSEQLEQRLGGAYPAHHYTTLDRSFVALVAYGPETKDALMDLQHRVLALHDDLISEHGLWFYAGVGQRCTQPQNLWESYEQARTAARYTAKNHVFLPYEVIGKDTAGFYYPVEISAKLQHFITTGNRQQVTELFSLLHRENFEERSLPLNLLNYLLSDLKNTLLKARFQIIPQGPEDGEKLRALDERLNEQMSFPRLEGTALAICGFFSRSAEPADPIPEVERYLKENFADPSMCLSKLSERFNISESYLSHMFKNRTGQNFSVYLEDLRLGEAARRLREGDVNLTALYEDLGYNNPTTFRRAFKKRYGITPSDMRQAGGRG